MYDFPLSDVLSAGVISIGLTLLYWSCSIKTMGALQQGGYSNKKFMKWYKRKDNLLSQRLILTFLLMIFSSAFCGLCCIFAGAKVASLVSLLPILFFAFAYRVADFIYALKVPYSNTPRFKRLSIIFVVTCFIFNYILVTILNIAAYYIDMELFTALGYCLVSVMFLLLPYIALLSNLIASPFENANNKKYILKAKAALKESSLIKIGITGSYGKTSVKNILAAILSEKYEVLSTPESYNTPVGIAKCVNGSALDKKEVFIAEMGARHVGDISELCEIVDIDYAILTGVCPQHLESFESEENIINEKSEILRRAKICSVTPVISGLKGKLQGCNEVITLGKEVVAEDIVSDKNGTSFTFKYQDRVLQLSTKLLNAHSAENIALAAVIAVKLGLSDEEIINGVAKIEYIDHRLSVLRSGGVTVIDDSYNSNIVGAKHAIQTLKSFDGEKFVLTPGLVELGILEVKENEKLGAELVGAGNVILIGETLVGAVKNGYIDAGGDPKKLTVVKTLLDATKLLEEKMKDGDTVLFLNDLPDVY